jgi:hypothetical protein
MRICPTTGCGQLIASTAVRCPAHEQEDQQRRRRKVRELGNDRAHWQAVRAARLGIASGLCELRINCSGAPATHVHLLPELEGCHDQATVADCRACCASCSGAVDAPRAHGRGAGGQRGSIDRPDPAPVPRHHRPERTLTDEAT